MQNTRVPNAEPCEMQLIQERQSHKGRANTHNHNGGATKW